MYLDTGYIRCDGGFTQTQSLHFPPRLGLPSSGTEVAKLAVSGPERARPGDSRRPHSHPGAPKLALELLFAAP